MPAAQGYQVVRQPDGKLAIYSGLLGVLVQVGLTPVEAQTALIYRGATEGSAAKEVNAVCEGKNPYGVAQLTWAQVSE